MIGIHRKKVFIFGIFILSVLPNIILAGDCSFVDSTEEKKVPIKYSVIFPKEVFNRAVDNLRAYCCDKNSDTIKVCKSADKVDDYPQSEYLYDHLVDIAFRRLDGFTGNYSYGMEPDIMGLERRNFVSKASESITGDIAAKIGTEYEKYRKLKWYQYSDDILLDYNNIEKISLADKYYFTCDIIQELINSDLVGREKSSSVYYNKCKQMAYNRIQDENVYVKTVMIDVSNQLLKSGFDAYIMKYFVQEKLLSLKEKVVEFVNTFYTIFKQAPVSTSCSK